MASRPTLPYFAPAHLLPAPLPTVAEILASERHLSTLGAMVVVVGDHFVVKYGGAVHLQEGENMLFVRQSTSIPVPTVYALFNDQETGMNFIVQEYISGKPLSSLWSSFGRPEKEALALQLRRHMAELRSIPSPGYYGGIWGQPTQDYTFKDPKLVHDPHQDSAISGPHSTEEQWTDAMWRCLECKVNSPLRSTLQMRRRVYHAIFKGHKSVFTHADLDRRNILIRDDNKTAVLIDWAYSGWYPSYWEYCHLATMLAGCEDDWWEWLPRILDEYIPELGWMETHRSLLIIGSY